MRKEYVKKELEKRIEAMDCQSLDLVMKNGDKICLEPWRDGRVEIWFSEISQIYYAKDLDELTEILMNHPAKQNELEDEEKRYFEENEPKIKKFFHEHFEGKTWDEIRNDEEEYENWSWYSDWHKDIYGYRPHDIVCGVYVRPY